MVTLEQVQSRITKLQKQAEELLRKKNTSIIADIKALLAKHGLTTADIDGHTGTTKSGAKRGPKPAAKRADKATVVAAKKPAASVKGKLPPKYINPKTGETWSGRARPPAWIANVKDRSKFLIASGADIALAASASSTSKAKGAAKKGSAVSGATPRKGQPKGQQAAKYLEPKTGATWSGRGRAPAWLAGAKDRTSFLIDGAGAVANKGRTVNKADKLKSAGKSDAAGKTGAATNVVAKDAAATKSSTVKKVAPASKKVAAKKVAAPLAKRAVVKKAAGKKAVAVKAVTAKAGTTATPEASVEVGA